MKVEIARNDYIFETTEFFGDEFLAFDIAFVLDLYLRLLDHFGAHFVIGNEFFQLRKNSLQRFEGDIVAHQDFVELPALRQRL